MARRRFRPPEYLRSLSTWCPPTLQQRRPLASGRPSSPLRVPRRLFTAPGQNLSNSTYVGVGPSGRLTLKLGTNGQTDLVIRVTGFFTATTAGSGMVPVSGKRVVDTRTGVGAPVGKIRAGQSIDINVADANVSLDATAVAVSLTVFADHNSYVSMVSAGRSYTGHERRGSRRRPFSRD